MKLSGVKILIISLSACEQSLARYKRPGNFIEVKHTVHNDATRNKRPASFFTGVKELTFPPVPWILQILHSLYILRCFT